MLPGNKLFDVTMSLVVLITAVRGTVNAGESAIATKVSGGENHTLVLTESNSAWSGGDNSYYQLGTGNDHDEWTLIRVRGGAMGTMYLEDIGDVDAGWKHSLALDVSGFVWAWGR